jgi:hypothetical protein
MRIAATLLVISVAVVATPALGAGSCAKLALADTSPLTVKGTRFQAGERVKLVVSQSVSLSRLVRAGTRGGFTAKFTVNLGRCDPLLVRAIGARGSRATVDLTQIACAPAP